MKKKNVIVGVPADKIEKRIFIIRGRKIMLDRDLAKLYGVTTGNLNLAVKRNLERFPDDFMFQLAKEEFQNLILQFAISRWGGPRKLPYAFTEQGIAMLSSVLSSKRAIQINIQIMRIFTKIRGLTLNYEDLRQKIESMERRYDKKFRIIFNAIKDELPPLGEA